MPLPVISGHRRQVRWRRRGAGRWLPGVRNHGPRILTRSPIPLPTLAVPSAFTVSESAELELALWDAAMARGWEVPLSSVGMTMHEQLTRMIANHTTDLDAIWALEYIPARMGGEDDADRNGGFILRYFETFCYCFAPTLTRWGTGATMAFFNALDEGCPRRFITPSILLMLTSYHHWMGEEDEGEVIADMQHQDPDYNGSDVFKRKDFDRMFPLHSGKSDLGELPVEIRPIVEELNQLNDELRARNAAVGEEFEPWWSGAMMPMKKGFRTRAFNHLEHTINESYEQIQQVGGGDQCWTWEFKAEQADQLLDVIEKGSRQALLCEQLLRAVRTSINPINDC